MTKKDVKVADLKESPAEEAPGADAPLTPLEQLQAWREAGVPNALIEVVTGADGSIIKVSRLDQTRH